MVIVASLIIAACSLAVNITAGLGERKRPFSLLRLTGVPLGPCVASSRWKGVATSSRGCDLARDRSRRCSAVPQIPGRHRISVPGITYWAAVLGGLVASLAIIAATFPLLNRMTGPEVARNE